MSSGMEIEKSIWGGGVIHSTTPVLAETEWDLDTTLDQQTEEEHEGLAKVLIHNDDITPMDFVVIVLQRIFQLSPLEAEHVMIVAHFNGLALVAMLPFSEAKQRVGKAHFAAQMEGYPLLFTIEPA
jgi:ATP-dependent Clp protease adaptor protein ClpS